jgi:thiol-disulfide isomerase/thioredoxin
MIDSKLWNEGHTIAEYVELAEYYQKELKVRLRDIRITQSECQKLKSINSPRKVLVLTESWCPDCLMNLPVLAKMAECATNMEIKVFIREENPEIKDYFKQFQIENIPVFWVMDEHFNKIGVWVERPKTAIRKLDRWKKENPDYSQIKMDNSIDPIEKKKKLAPLVEQLVDEMWNWYDTGLQSDTLTEIFDILN